MDAIKRPRRLTCDGLRGLSLLEGYLATTPGGLYVVLAVAVAMDGVDLAFVAAVQVVGIYVGGLLFIAGFMVWVGKYHWAKSTGIAFAVMATAFLMFEVWFKVPLFKGALQPLRFLGY